MSGIIGVVTIVLSLIFGLVFLAATHADASTLLSLVSTMVMIVNTIMTVNTRSDVKALTAQSNGTQNKLIDAAIHSSPPADR